MKKIDMHCHYYPKEYVKEVTKRSSFSDHYLPVWESTEARIADMDKFGIERQVLSPSSPFVYFEDSKLSVDLAQMSNDFLSDICQKYPNRFSGFINVPLNNVKDAMDELKRTIKAPGVVGVGLGTNVRDKLLSAPEFGPFFEEIDRLGLPVDIHPGSPTGVYDIREYKDFTRSVGWLWETAMSIGKMALSGFFEKYKNIKMILSHLGGALPFVYTSMDMAQKRNIAKEYVAPKPVSEYLKKLYADTARLVTAPILACALDLYGEDHVVYGTDIPYANDVTELNLPRLEREIKMSDRLRQDILYNNAKRLLKI